MFYGSKQKSTSNKCSGLGNLPQSGSGTVLGCFFFPMEMIVSLLFLEAADVKLQECIYNQAFECGQLRATRSFVSCLMVRANE